MVDLKLGIQCTIDDSYPWEIRRRPMHNVNIILSGISLQREMLVYSMADFVGWAALPSLFEFSGPSFLDMKCK